MKRLVALLLVIVIWLSFLSASAAQGVNILLLGTDELGEKVTGQEKSSRADAIFILHIGDEETGARVLSVERDYLVELPENGRNKLGTATYFGGPELARDTVNKLFGIEIEHYAQIDIKSFIEAVDAIGGIDVEVYEDEVESVNAFISGIMSHFNLRLVTAGTNHLTGPEAWAFLGVRDSGKDSVKSNAERNGRQHRVMAAGMEKLRAMPLKDAIDLAYQILPLVKTNISTAKVLELIQLVLTSDSQDVDYLYTPTGEYRVRTVSLHRVVQVEDMDKEKETVRQYLGY